MGQVPDHFWMTTLIPTPGSAFRSTAKYYEQADTYQAETVLPVVSLSSGQSASGNAVFAGAKEWETIRNYENAGSKDLSTALIEDGSFSD